MYSTLTSKLPWRIETNTLKELRVVSADGETIYEEDWTALPDGLSQAMSQSLRERACANAAIMVLASQWDPLTKFKVPDESAVAALPWRIDGMDDQKIRVVSDKGEMIYEEDLASLPRMAEPLRSEVVGRMKANAELIVEFTQAYARRQVMGSSFDIDYDVIRKAYGWTIDVNGHLHGLINGDHGYEPTGIQLSETDLKIWQLGVAVFLTLQEIQKPVR